MTNCKLRDGITQAKWK